MPYASIDDLPPPIRAHLPPHAREIYLAAFNSA
nr:ChaB family protein [Bradyrhizobium sp. AUGA SZCCT0283]